MTDRHTELCDQRNVSVSEFTQIYTNFNCHVQVDCLQCCNSWPTEYVYSTLTINSCLASTHLSSNSFARFWLHQQHCVHSGMHSYCYCCAPFDLVRILNICINYALCHSVILAVVSSDQVSSRWDSTIKYRMTNNVLSDITSIKFVQCVKGTLRRRIAYILVHLESIYYQIFFYSKIVPNCAVAK